MEYSTLKFLEAVDEPQMPISTKLIRESLRLGTYPGKSQPLQEATSEIVSITLVDEPYGQGVAVKQADGHEYRYAADETHPKYDTPEKLCMAAQKLLKFRTSGAVLGWLHKNGILYSGSKREAKKTEEEVSREVHKELEDLARELHPEWSVSDVEAKVQAFISENNIMDDWDFYGMAPKEVRKFFD